MAFLDDTDIDEQSLHHPIWGAFLQVKDNLERLVALNLLWALQLVPAMVAFAFPSLPIVLRFLLFLYSATVIAVATGALFALVARICQDEAPRPETVRQAIREYALPGLRRLAPLYGLVGLNLLLILLATPAGLMMADVALRLLLLLLLVCSSYWGPLFAAHPERSLLVLLRQSVILVWRYPGPTLLTCLVSLAALTLGAISIGGLFLIVPVLVVILQTRRYQTVALCEQARSARSALRQQKNSLPHA